MPRFARVVVPGFPHHIIQRGHRRQRVFFGEDDKKIYLRLLRTYGIKAGLSYWAYCLMDNHVHLIAVPEYLDSFRRGLGVAHWKYSLIINLREDWKGYLWQSRFLSYPLDNHYLRAAVRYVELNPVRAGTVIKAEDYAWSSARAHLLRKSDPLLSNCLLTQEIGDWAGFLSVEPLDSEVKLIRQHMTTGRPLGSSDFIEKLETLTGRTLKENRRGRKPSK